MVLLFTTLYVGFLTSLGIHGMRVEAEQLAKSGHPVAQVEVNRSPAIDKDNPSWTPVQDGAK